MHNTNHMKKFIIFALLILCIPFGGVVLSAQESTIYRIYDENGYELTERQDVEVGDKFIDRNFNEYEIYLVDETSQTAKASYKKTYPRPKITKKGNATPISAKPKKIALYMTHNDESYIIGDGTESVYGAGGIHDIAKTIKKTLNSYGIDVTLDETLHIPHNSSAYSRSGVTAKKLLENKPDAIFDIHRDGASRQYYVTNVDGKERSKIRIVLGQSNPNSSTNLEFALYLLSVAETECPWLFHDIYWGKGHYNQALSNKSLLFEMGTHTIEKSYVEESAKELAKVINTTLYKTTVNEDNGDLTIGTPTEQPSVNDKLESPTTFVAWPVIVFPSIIVLGSIALALGLSAKHRKPNKKNKS